MPEVFKVWVQIERDTGTDEPTHAEPPDCIREFRNEDDARVLVESLLIVSASAALQTSDQLPRGRYPRQGRLAVCSWIDPEHYCSGCGRCMTGGCDGHNDLHSAICPFTFCKNCGAAEEECECGDYEDSEGESYCCYCGREVAPGHAPLCGSPGADPV